MSVLGRFRVLAILAAVLGPIVGFQSATAGEPGSPVGYWLTQSGDGVIQVARCSSGLCGRIVGIGRAPGEPMPTDVNGRSECGLTILTNEVLASGGVWDGSVTDPRDGSTYGTQLWLDDKDRLHIRGYLGIRLFGRTQTWTRYTGQVSEGCRIG